MNYYQHDCDECTYLGDVYVSGEHFDLYFCNQGGLHLPTVIARYGNEGSQYLSGLAHADLHPALSAGKKRAKARNFI